MVDKNNILKKKIADLKWLNEQLWIDLYYENPPLSAKVKNPDFTKSMIERRTKHQAEDMFQS